MDNSPYDPAQVINLRKPYRLISRIELESMTPDPRKCEKNAAAFMDSENPHSEEEWWALGEISTLRTALLLLNLHHQDFMQGGIDQHTYEVRSAEEYAKFKWLPAPLERSAEAPQAAEAGPK